MSQRESTSPLASPPCLALRRGFWGAQAAHSERRGDAGGREALPTPTAALGEGSPSGPGSHLSAVLPTVRARRRGSQPGRASRVSVGVTGSQPGGCGLRTCPWAPPGCSVDLLTVAGQTWSVFFIRDSPAPTSHRGSSQGHFLCPSPLASHRRPSCLVPTLAPTLSGAGGVPSAPCPCPLLPQAAAWCWAGSSLEGYRVTPGRTHPSRADSAKDSRVPEEQAR